MEARYNDREYSAIKMVGCKLATILVLIWSYLHIRRRKLDDIQVSVSVRLPLLIVCPYSEIQILIVKKYCIFLPSILSLFFKYNINLFVLIGSYLLYNVVLVLPYIDMNPPQVYTCSPSWTPLPPLSPLHPSGSSQCTSPEHLVSCIEPGLVIRFTYDTIHVSVPFS